MKRTDNHMQEKMPTVTFQIYQAQNTALLKLMIAAAVCSFVSNISYLIVSMVTNKIKELLIFCYLLSTES